MQTDGRLFSLPYGENKAGTFLIPPLRQDKEDRQNAEKGRAGLASRPWKKEKMIRASA